MWIIATYIEVDTPVTGLTPTIDIYKVSDNSKVVDAAAMSELAVGMYKYDFTGYDASETYVSVCDGGAALISRYAYGISAFKDHTPELAAIYVDNKFIKQMVSGRWKIDAGTKQMIFYEDDNTTEITRFNLYDRNGDPSIIGDEVFEREVV